MVALALAFMSCQGMQPKQQAAAIMLSYNKAYDDYQLRAADPNLTEDQKVILRRQKEILVQLYPKIKLYNSYAETGATPYQGIDVEINNLLFELEKLFLNQIE
jgi:hypothetical protein